MPGVKQIRQRRQTQRHRSSSSSSSSNFLSYAKMSSILCLCQCQCVSTAFGQSAHARSLGQNCHPECFEPERNWLGYAFGPLSLAINLRNVKVKPGS
ncbi:uncharacterized protein Dyak_GE28676, isoform A [Drosophila yakuba]|uniref:Uncharacterized protein, isoform A n=1 Tax=Drosophila yakuba TaxID=7245 RepID=A0A0R1E6D3_DROYA|nr:uncharacterized protein Dyak_GE28676, isoform A [Drosophila yakuba]